MGLPSALGGKGGADPVQLPEFPVLPKDVKDRFPSLVQWEKDFNDFLKRYARALRQGVTLK